MIEPIQVAGGIIALWLVRPTLRSWLEYQDDRRLRKTDADERDRLAKAVLTTRHLVRHGYGIERALEVACSGWYASRKANGLPALKQRHQIAQILRVAPDLYRKEKKVAWADGHGGHRPRDTGSRPATPPPAPPDRGGKKPNPHGLPDVDVIEGMAREVKPQEDLSKPFGGVIVPPDVEYTIDQRRGIVHVHAPGEGPEFLSDDELRRVYEIDPIEAELKREDTDWAAVERLVEEKIKNEDSQRHG